MLSEKEFEQKIREEKQKLVEEILELVTTERNEIESQSREDALKTVYDTIENKYKKSTENLAHPDKSSQEEYARTTKLNEDDIDYWVTYNNNLQNRGDTLETSCEELTPIEGRELFNNICQERLGITGEEFVEKYRNYNKPCGESAVIDEIIMLLPFWGIEK